MREQDTPIIFFFLFFPWFGVVVELGSSSSLFLLIPRLMVEVFSFSTPFGAFFPFLEDFPSFFDALLEDFSDLIQFFASLIAINLSGSSEFFSLSKPSFHSLIVLFTTVANGMLEQLNQETNTE
eukprot:TRINITY_DN2156_c0_g1_i14.p1 TRINITY_DN2156_c0_g1~~TRINITY_DN2156_c0_g1_i14.p1  ORF type:complete len:124 (-),score=29.40 TRINITY_DN2156_c0_g1_i14:248-619(-)